MHSTLHDVMKGVSGAEDVVMGLDANLRQSQDLATAIYPEHPLAASSLVVLVCAAVCAEGRRDSRQLDKDGFASDQEGDHLGDPHGDALLASAE